MSFCPIFPTIELGNPFPLFLYYTTLDCFRIRTRFYFIWIIADSINNLAGLGFNGYDAFGRPRWDLVSNIFPLEIEFALNMRDIATRWNAQSSNWLRRYGTVLFVILCRSELVLSLSLSLSLSFLSPYKYRCVYERSLIAPTLVTYTVSAIWHGFYPGYYFTFIFFGIVTVAARKVTINLHGIIQTPGTGIIIVVFSQIRRLIRPYFQGSLPLKLGYHVITWALTKLFLDFGALPVELMWLRAALRFWG